MTLALVSRPPNWMKAAGPNLKAARGFVYDVSSWTELKQHAALQSLRRLG
jgi:hypothetical protein